MIYPSDEPLKLTLYSWGTIMVIFILGGFIEGYGGLYMKSYFGVSLIVYAALGKALSTLIKYFMQAYHNYKRKAVTGVSPLAMAVDLSGATLALI